MTFWTFTAILIGYFVYKDNKDEIYEHLRKKKIKKEDQKMDKNEPETTSKFTIDPYTDLKFELRQVKETQEDLLDKINMILHKQDYPFKPDGAKVGDGYFGRVPEGGFKRFRDKADYLKYIETIL